MKKFILLVEDNPDHELLLANVQKHISTPIIFARDGAVAIDFLFTTGDYDGRDISTSPSLILLDLKLQKVSGFEVLRRIRSDARTKIIPVVIFSSSTEEQDIIACYNFGANSYVCKPVDYGRYCETMKLVTKYWLSLNRYVPGQPILAILS